MTKRFRDYTDAELLTLDNETVNDAIRIEAIERCIQPPIPLSEALKRSEWMGYQKPAQAIEVFEIVTIDKYGSSDPTGVAYLTKDAAQAALAGLVAVHEDTYSNDKGWKMHNCTPTVASRWIGVSKSDQAWAKLEEFRQDNTEFNKVVDECIERLSTVRQEAYNKRVREEKWAEYMRLAGNNREVAEGFWKKIEQTSIPA